jgi:uncharacterized protein (DUF2147 family)
MRTIAVFIIVLFVFAKANSQGITGTWQTMDDETGVIKSHVNIYEKNGKYYGKVIKIVDTKKGLNPLCIDCEGSKKNQSVLGMVVISGIRKKGAAFKDGTILDSDNGKTYECKMWLNEDNPNLLMVRGYILMIYRTQIWLRL